MTITDPLKPLDDLAEHFNKRADAWRNHYKKNFRDPAAARVGFERGDGFEQAGVRLRAAINEARAELEKQKGVTQ